VLLVWRGVLRLLAVFNQLEPVLRLKLINAKLQLGVKDELRAGLNPTQVVDYDVLFYAKIDALL